MDGIGTGVVFGPGGIQAIGGGMTLIIPVGAIGTMGIGGGTILIT